MRSGVEPGPLPELAGCTARARPPGSRPTSSTRVTAKSSRSASRAHLGARGLEAGHRRGRRGSSTPAPTPATRAPARARARRASPPSRSRTCAAIARAISRSSVSSQQLTATSGGRAPTAIAPSVGCGRGGPEVGRARRERLGAQLGQRTALRVGVVVEEHGQRRDRSATHSANATRRGGRDLVVLVERAERARRRARRAAGARRRGRCRSSCSATGARERRDRVSASRGPGPASVNTDRWWSASACTVEQRRAARVGERVEHGARRGPPTRSGRTRARDHSGCHGPDRL